MRNEAGHWPEVCKKSLQAMVADMQEGIAARVLRALLASPSCRRCRRASWNGAAGSPQPLLRRPGRHALPRRSAGTRRSAASPSSCEARRPTRTSSTPAAARPTRPASCCSSSPGCTAPTTSTTARYYCHQASGVGLGQALGTGTATVTLDDVENGRPVRPHRRQPGVEPSAADADADAASAAAAGTSIVINPVKEVGLVNFRVPSDVRSLLFGSKIASLYVQPHIGGDIALLTGVAKLLLERGADRPRVHRRRRPRASTTSRRRCEATSWDEIERGSRRRSRPTIERDRRRVRRGEERRLRLDDGHHASRARRRQRAGDRQPGPAARHGRPAAARACCRSAATRNVQGIGSVGVAPKLKQAILDNLEQHFGVELPTLAGPATRWPACRRPTRGEMRSAFCLGGNLFGSNPDAAFASRGARQARAGHLPQHDAEHRPRLGPRPGDAHPAGAGPRRGAAADDAGVDVQLRPAQRRRHAAAGRARAARSTIIAALAERVLGDAAPVDWRDAASSTATIRAADRQDRARLRAARRRSTGRSRSSTIAGRIVPRAALPDAERARRSSRRAPAAASCAAATASCG